MSDSVVSISRDSVKVLLLLARQVCQHAQEALGAAPCSVAREAITQLEGLPDEIGAYLGVGEIIGRCEFCEEIILSDEFYSSGDGYLCATCCAGAPADDGTPQATDESGT